MPRARIHIDPLRPLPRGLNKHGKRYRARDAKTRTWRYFGDDYKAACDAYRDFLASRSALGVFTVARLLDWFTDDHGPVLVASGELSPRTLKDYKRDAIKLKKHLGHIPAAAMETHHVAKYVTTRAKTAPGHVNKERACLSAAYTAAINDAGKVAVNPVRGSKLISRTGSERLVSDAEYLAVYRVAGRSERIAMLLGLRTLQRPADVLKMGPRDVRRDGDQWLLRVKQNKTGALIDIVLDGELLQMVQEHMRSHPLISTFVFTERADRYGRRARPYTVDGLGAILRRTVEDAGQHNVALAHMRPKGATALYKSSAEIRHIQALLGHKTEDMTRRYIRQLMPEPVAANNVPVIAAVD